MKKVQIYHNPRCSKSRETLALIQDQGREPEVIEYLKSPPTTAELEKILNALGLEPQQIIRNKEPRYTELGLAKKSLSRKELIQILSQNPILIERPIVVNGNKAALGRPPEAVLAILK